MLDQVQPGCRPLFRFYAAGIGVGECRRQCPCEAADEEVIDLFGGELRQPDDEPAKRPLDPFAGHRQHIVVGEEELGPACHDDFCPAGGRRPAVGVGPVVEGSQQGAEARDCALVGDAGGEFVETIEDQYEAALGEHVAEGVEVWPADLGVHQMLGDEPVELDGFLQLPQLDQHRVHMWQVAG